MNLLAFAYIIRSLLLLLGAIKSVSLPVSTELIYTSKWKSKTQIPKSLYLLHSVEKMRKKEHDTLRYTRERKGHKTHGSRCWVEIHDKSLIKKDGKYILLQSEKEQTRVIAQL